MVSHPELSNSNNSQETNPPITMLTPNKHEKARPLARAPPYSRLDHHFQTRLIDLCTEYQGTYFECEHLDKFWDTIANALRRQVPFPLTGKDVEAWVEGICHEAKQCLLRREIVPHRVDREDLDIAIEDWLDIEGKRLLQRGSAQMQLGYLLAYGPEESSEENLFTSSCLSRLRENAGRMKTAATEKGKASRRTGVLLIRKIEELVSKPTQEPTQKGPATQKSRGGIEDRTGEKLFPMIDPDTEIIKSPTQDRRITHENNTSSLLPATTLSSPLGSLGSGSDVSDKPIPAEKPATRPSNPSSLNMDCNPNDRDEQHGCVPIDSVLEVTQQNAQGSLCRPSDAQEDRTRRHRASLNIGHMSNPGRPAVKKFVLNPSSREKPTQRKNVGSLSPESLARGSNGPRVDTNTSASTARVDRQPKETTLVAAVSTASQKAKRKRGSIKVNSSPNKRYQKQDSMMPKSSVSLGKAPQNLIRHTCHGEKTSKSPSAGSHRTLVRSCDRERAKNPFGEVPIIDLT
ncbi:hypothetical protein F5Y05DRAFT_246710 [Hypoxylon sp. FL0543]|nr:hypothetical protein F5Y05DRAFT_246710 [Hypoxylon sp. FL0543]